MADIRETIAKVLEDGFQMTGAFSYSCKDSDVPNPGLCVDGAGTIGLPLGPRDAEAIKGTAELDKNGHSWILGADTVRFENTLAWPAFLDDALRKVCGGLGIREEESNPRCELLHMRLSEGGSSMVEPAVPEKVDKIVAVFAIILPSKFNGGTVRFTHGDGAESHECTPRTVMDSTVIAWHRGSVVNAQPITEGYQLALYYGIVHTTDHPVPALAAQDAILARLNQVLSSWDEGARDDSVPSKMVYLLKNKYAQEKLNAAALTGVDARTIRLIKTAARRHGTRLGLATLVCTEEGLGLIAQRSDSDDDDWWNEEENIEGFDDLMDIETSIKLQQLVDLDGRPLQALLELDLDNETIPADLETSVKSGKPDKRLIGFVDVNELRLRQVYYHNVLVIWPRWSELGHPEPEAGDAEPSAKRRRTED